MYLSLTKKQVSAVAEAIDAQIGLLRESINGTFQITELGRQVILEELDELRCIQKKIEQGKRREVKRAQLRGK